MVIQYAHFKLLLLPDKLCSEEAVFILNWQSFDILKVSEIPFQIRCIKDWAVPSTTIK